jgi:prevent-host-death family protein
MNRELLQMQTEAGVRELKTHLSTYLRKVKAGETIIITERGVPVGRIVPIAQTEESQLAALQAAGLVEWDGNALLPLVPVAKNSAQLTVAELLLEDRE